MILQSQTKVSYCEMGIGCWRWKFSWLCAWLCTFEK